MLHRVKRLLIYSKKVLYNYLYYNFNQDIVQGQIQL